ncbi:Universal stress protein family protein [Haladaptatus litoreus]|uniref:Universal stress protein family protein n=1 Tax=Haladaptatus litoreus TaxID=553468 RepID=A0A1N7E596_9EURY|nr:universal stress protein [Haladaptatus litoreus]SIR83269.1 Universal stress protein family protein [Haladaptatus litoreus]
MTHIVVGTDSAETSEKICAYLQSRLDGNESISVLNSLHGGNDEEKVRDGQDALSVFEEQLGELAAVETEQNTGASDPAHDILTLADEEDADEIVIGLSQKRSPAQKVLFGSITQSVLTQTGHPVVGVPLKSD